MVRLYVDMMRPWPVAEKGAVARSSQWRTLPQEAQNRLMFFQSEAEAWIPGAQSRPATLSGVRGQMPGRAFQNDRKTCGVGCRAAPIGASSQRSCRERKLSHMPEDSLLLEKFGPLQGVKIVSTGSHPRAPPARPAPALKKSSR